MDSSNEFNQIDDNSIQIDHGEIYKNEIENHLYDVKEIEPNNNNKYERIDTHETFKPVVKNDGSNQILSLITDSGDVIDCPNKNYENLQSSIKSQLTVHQSIDSFLKHDQSDNDGLVVPHPTPENSITINEYQHYYSDNCLNDNEEKDTEYPLTYIDSQHAILIERELAVIPNKSQENELNINTTTEYSYEDNQNSTNSLFMCHLSLFDIEYCTTSTCLVLPQFVQNHHESFNSFQQLWSSQVYSIKLINSNTSETTLSILWSLIILLSKLIIIGLYALYSCAKILRYDTLLFGFCYLLGALFGMNAYFFIDFLLILTCIISIFVATYEKWLFRYVNLNEYDNNDNGLNNIESENQYWKRIKLAAYGLAIGTISTYII